MQDTEYVEPIHEPPRLAPGKLRAKYLLDKVASGLLFVLLLPLFAVVAAAIGIEGLFSRESRGPVFVSQERISAGRPFRMPKFRTYYLSDDAFLKHYEDTTFFINNRRQTRVGRVLRKHYLDELPQLLKRTRGPDEPGRPAPVARQAVPRDPGARLYWQEAAPRRHLRASPVDQGRHGEEPPRSRRCAGGGVRAGTARSGSSSSIFGSFSIRCA